MNAAFNTAHVIYQLKSGKMTRVKEPRGLVTNCNFVITSHGGKYDWSGFRTLEECVRQFDALESNGRDDGFYRVEER